MPLAQRTAIVTGGSRGIGRAIAVALGQAGMNVVVNYHSNAAAAEETAGMILEAGGTPMILQADVGSDEDRKTLVNRTIDKFGSIECLVNNAGVAPRVRADLLEAGEESFDEVLETNLKGPYFLSQLVAQHMIKQQEKIMAELADTPRSSSVDADAPLPPVIISIGSISAYTASVNRGDYCIAKAGLAMMTKLFAARLAEHGINVYEVRPGIIETDMTSGVKAKYDKLIFEEGLTPIARWGQANDVAQAVLAIAKGHLPFSTGQVIDVDGGFHLRTL